MFLPPGWVRHCAPHRFLSESAAKPAFLSLPRQLILQGNYRNYGTWADQEHCTPSVAHQGRALPLTRFHTVVQEGLWRRKVLAQREHGLSEALLTCAEPPWHSVPQFPIRKGPEFFQQNSICTVYYSGKDRGYIGCTTAKMGPFGTVNMCVIPVLFASAFQLCVFIGRCGWMVWVWYKGQGDLCLQSHQHCTEWSLCLPSFQPLHHILYSKSMSQDKTGTKGYQVFSRINFPALHHWAPAWTPEPGIWGPIHFFRGSPGLNGSKTTAWTSGHTALYPLFWDRSHCPADGHWAPMP